MAMKSISKSQVSVLTNKYERVHCKSPCGKGCWAFQIGKDEDDYKFFSGSYKEAKSQAIEEASKVGCYTIYVLG